MDLQLEEVLVTTRIVYTDGLSDHSDYCCGASSASSASSSCTPYGSPVHTSRESRLIMNDRDKGIYNSLGSSSSPFGKPTYTELGLQRGWQKRGIMFKTGPKPSWYSRWRKRVFVLKNNFLYYFPPSKKLESTSVLGAIYLKNAIIEKTSLPLQNNVLKITPPVARRRGWDEDDESCIFHIGFVTEEGRDEWFEELQQVSFSHQFPTEKKPLLTKAMTFRHDKDSTEFTKGSL